MRWKRKIGLWMAMLAIPAAAGAADLVNPFTESYQEIPMKTTVKEGTLLVSDSRSIQMQREFWLKGQLREEDGFIITMLMLLERRSGW